MDNPFKKFTTGVTQAWANGFGYKEAMNDNLIAFDVDEELYEDCMAQLDDYTEKYLEVAVVLSVPLMISDGVYVQTEVSKEEAIKFVQDRKPANFSGHETTKLVGLTPATDRAMCKGYDKALVIKPLSRLEFGREYTAEEIEKIGVKYLVISYEEGKLE
jgi:hypothetical protein